MKRNLRGLISVRQAVERTRLSEKHIRNLIRTGKLPVIRLGYNLLLSERDIEKLIKPQEAA